MEETTHATLYTDATTVFCNNSSLFLLIEDPRRVNCWAPSSNASAGWAAKTFAKGVCVYVCVCVGVCVCMCVRVCELVYAYVDFGQQGP